MNYQYDASNKARKGERDVSVFYRRGLCASVVAAVLTLVMPAQNLDLGTQSLNLLNSVNYTQAVIAEVAPPKTLDAANIIEQPKSLTPKVDVYTDPVVQLASLNFAPKDLMRPKLAPRLAPRPTQKPILKSKPLAIPKAVSPSINTPRQLSRKLFGSVEFKFEDELKIKSWSGVYSNFSQNTRTLELCIKADAACTDPVLGSWAYDLRALKGQPKLHIMRQINDRANSIRHVNDAAIYGRSDYWAAPAEFLTNSGDCEDFALLKFASLLALGFDNNDMRLVVGILNDGTPHAILSVNVNGQDYILDNRRSEIFIAAHRRDYTPKYSMNLTDRWTHVMPNKSQA